MKTKMLLSALAFVFLMLGQPVESAGAQTCSNATLYGDYAFTINGKIIPPGATQFVAQQGVAMTHYDGAGKLTQVDFLMTNGVPAINPSTDVNGHGFRTNESGTYTVNPDCTGSLTINFYTKFDTLSATINVKFVLATGGKEVREVVQSITAYPPGGPTTGVSIPATVVADGKKLEPLDNED